MAGPVTLPYYYSSLDGISWVQETEASPLYKHHNLLSINNQFVEIVGVYNATNQSILSSSDGHNWTPPVELPLAYNSGAGDGYVNTPVISDAIYFKGIDLLAGVFGSYSGLMIVSTNSTNWTKITTSPENFIFAMAFGKGALVAVGSAGPTPGFASLQGSPAPILVCTNGISFSIAPLASTQALANVSFNGTNFIAVGRNGALQRSTNGIHWFVRPAATSSDLAAVCYGSNLWVAVGVGGTIVTSPDGLVWTLRNSGTSLNLYGVAFHEDRFVTVGEQGTVLTSADGISWTGQFADTPSALLRIAWGNGRFVAVGAAGAVLTSPDGQIWTSQTPPTTNTLYGLSYGNGQFLAVGVLPTVNFGAADNLNQLLSSYDGITWATVPSPSYHSYAASAFGANTFWVAGDRGSILESDVLTAQPVISARFTAGTLQLTVKGMSGQAFRIQACSNLSGNFWSDKVLISNSQPIEVWNDAETTNFPVRLYRTVSP